MPMRKHNLDYVFDYIVRFKREHGGQSPTTRNIMAHCGITSTGVARNILCRLERAGRLSLIGDPGGRFIFIPGGEWRYSARGKPEPAFAGDPDLPPG